jgi:3-hydroxyisobutyrate dehydrogenase-like beta-hydroxyacid dehydrogenase
MTWRGPIGVAGCGAMGLPMAEALGRAGFEVYGYDVRPLAEFGDFAANMVGSPAELAERCDVVISVVRDAAQTRDLCFGKRSLFNTNSPPATLVISSTVSPRFVIALRDELPGSVALVDAPMSGAPVAARDASLSFMLGGESEHLAPLMPAFEAMGDSIFTLGTLGSGMTAKVLNNYVACAGVVTVRRAFARAQGLGMDIEALRAVMTASSGATWFGSRFDVIDWSHEGYSPDNTLGIIDKDVCASLDAIDGMAPPLGADAFDEAMLKALRALEPYIPLMEPS